MSAAHPELIVVPRSGPPSFEESLRATVRDAPYLGIALLVHLAVLFVFMNMTQVIPLPVEAPIITASPESVAPPIAPPTVDLTKVVEDVPPTIESPTVTEVTDTSVTDLPDSLADSDASADMFTADASGVLGVGIGRTGSGTPGIRGIPGGRSNAGTPTEEAVDDALRWLKHHQNRDGYWSAEAFDDECGKQGNDGACDGRGNPRFDVGVTGLSLLAFLGAGNTDRYGAYQATVYEGIRFLLDIQDADGSFAPPGSTQGTYDHVIASLALCENYLYSPASFRLKKPAQKAMNALYAMRTPGSGWRYMPDHNEMAIPSRTADTSVTGWAILAMSTARKAGLYVDQDSWDDSLAFLDEMTDSSTGRTGYIEHGGAVAREAQTAVAWPAEQSEAMTAVAVLCRIFADPDLEDAHNREMVDKGAELLAAMPPVWDDNEAGRRDYYYWYYGAYAMYQLGGQNWRLWERALLKSVLPEQHREGERKGSWDPQHDPWGHAGGRVYTTAINTLTLEVYYRYAR